MFWRGIARHSRRGKARQAAARCVGALQGEAGTVRHGIVWIGLARRGRQGMARHGDVWIGAARQERLGKALLVMFRRSMAWHGS